MAAMQRGVGVGGGGMFQSVSTVTLSAMQTVNLYVSCGVCVV